MTAIKNRRKQSRLLSSLGNFDLGGNTIQAATSMVLRNPTWVSKTSSITLITMHIAHQSS